MILSLEFSSVPNLKSYLGGNEYVVRASISGSFMSGFRYLPGRLNSLQSWPSMWSLSFDIQLNIFVRLGRGRWLQGEPLSGWLQSMEDCWLCVAKSALWLALLSVCVLYFGSACDPNTVRNLSMVTAQHFFLCKEQKRFGFSARIPTQVIMLLPAEFPHSFNCSSRPSLPLLKKCKHRPTAVFQERSSGCSAEASEATLPCIMYARFVPSKDCCIQSRYSAALVFLCMTLA